MKRILTLAFTLLIPLLSFAQPTGEKIEYFLPKGDFTYNKSISTPAQFLGYEIGDMHVSSHEIYNYFEHLTSQTDRFKFEYHGKTYQNRPLMYVTVTSEKNHQNIDAIMEEHLKLSDPTYKGEIDYESMPIVIWLGYSIHGNEASAVSAALPVAYFLAAAQGEELDKILENSIIVIHPLINPDGNDNFAAWVNSARSFTHVSDPVSREFNSPWPGNRSNHYWFDLNRDVLFTQHPESRSKVDIFLKWMPNIVNDHHEQGSNSHFFFMPSIKSRTNPLTHSDNWDLTARVGEYHAKELDKIGTMYFTKTSFDDFYYGKGSTYPDIHGAIGMLFEQGSSRGHIRSTTNGILTLAMGTRNQAYTSYSTIRAAMEMKTDLLKYQRDSYVEGYNEAAENKFAGYVIGGSKSRGINYHFVDLLLRQNVEVYKLSEDVVGDGKEFEKEYSYFVPVAQKESRKVNTLFENVTEYLDSAFYDISAWTFSEASNLNVLKVRSIEKGEKLESISILPGNIMAGKSEYGYLIPAHEYYSHKVIYELQKHDLRLKVSNAPFDYKVNGDITKFGYGTVLVQVPDQSLNKDEIYNEVTKLSKKYGVDIYPVQAGFGENTELGSGRFAHFTMPKAAIIVGPGASSLESGEAWFLFDQRMEIPLTLMVNTLVSKSSLKNYNTLIIAGSPTLSTAAQTALKDWVQDGGRLVAIGSAWSLTNRLGITNLTTKRNVYAGDKGTTPRAYAGRSTETVGRAVGGVILKTDIDVSHPLCYGYDQDQLSIFHRGVTVFNNIKDPFNIPIRFTDSPVVSGYVSKDNVKNLSGAPSVLAGSYGSGRVVVFNSNPNFRGFWYGTQKLFYNAIFFSSNIYASKLESLEGKE